MEQYGNGILKKVCTRLYRLYPCQWFSSAANVSCRTEFGVRPYARGRRRLMRSSKLRTDLPTLRRSLRNGIVATAIATVSAVIVPAAAAIEHRPAPQAAAVSSGEKNASELAHESGHPVEVTDATTE